MSLVQLAQERTLPRFQQMDAATLQWIADNDPRLGYSGKTKLGSRLGVVASLKISRRWFLEPRTIDTLHGFKHLWRCGWYALYLSEILQLHKSATRNLVVAALLHDIRRQDDKDDTGHSERATAWLQDHIEAIQEYMQVSLDDSDVEEVAASIALHEIPYSKFSGRQADLYRKYKTCVDGLKTADALDRYRLPKLKWWINIEYLRLIPPRWLMQTAFDLILRTECSSSADWTAPWALLESLDPC